MRVDLTGRTFLVTGGSSGIGRAIALRAREAGAQVAIMGRRKDAIERAAEEIGALAVAGDVRDPADAARAVSACVGRFHGLTTLVNAAGVIGGAGTADTPREEWERILSINVDGTVEMCRAALDPLKQAGERGSIVNLSSVTGTRPFAQVTAYCMSKAAIDMYTRCLALELAPQRVRVNAIAPGVVVTNLHTATGAVKDYPAFLARGKETHPLGFVGEPDDVAWMALYLASDLARWVTGGVFPLDGGRACMSAR
jgi:NAD(P)-dependent dehydrogenase (short-subunit alcohol dehydrogenase family)